jgi:hypothetical protein
MAFRDACIRPHSNGPVLTWPAPSAPGGAPKQEHWVLDSFRRDPWGGLAMVASEWHGRRRAPTHSVQIGLAILWQLAVRSSRYATGRVQDLA